MNKIIILTAYLLFLSSCAPEQSKLSINPLKDSKWLQKDALGSIYTSIDFSGKTLFQHDSRIMNKHKIKHPEFNDNYVLWRGRHDGSCWVSANLTLLVYHMMKDGPEKFQEVLDRMKVVSASYSHTDPLYLKNNDPKDFFDIFELIKTDFRYRHAFDLINHDNIYKALNHGLRKLLAAFERTKKEIGYAAKVEEPHSWGYADAFADFFPQKLGLEPFPVIDYFSLPLYFSKKNKLPTMLIFFTSSGFIDILVEKSFSDKVNNGDI